MSFRNVLLLLLVAGALHGSVLRGVVVEHATGKPLARTVVTAQAIGGTPGGIQSTRADRFGGFEFPSLATGMYMVSAAREGFATAWYGQKNWKSAGMPVVLEEAGMAFLNIRLQRFGAIAGVVVDEEETGLSEHEVAAYRKTRPPRLVARVKSDERGAFRIGGLEPGTYYVRTVGREYEEGSYLPTFARESAAVEQAQTVEVELDGQTNNVVLKPTPGKLVHLTGAVSGAMGMPVTVTLVSDMGRQTATTTGAFRFDQLAPGQYEIYAVSSMGARMQGAYQELMISKDTEMGLALRPVGEFTIALETGQGSISDFRQTRLRARRKDLAGEGPAEVVRLNWNRALLPPGRWELQLQPPPQYCVTGFAGSRGESPTVRADGWHEFTSGSNLVRFTLSARPASMSGAVTSSGTALVGVPVFLEPYDDTARRRAGELRTVFTDARGRYQFGGLPPGSYRLLATFEYRAPEEEAMDVAAARSIRVDEGRESLQDLELYVIR